MEKILEVNVDDIGNGGVYSLIRNVIIGKPSEVQIDIASIEQFENKKNVDELNSMGCDVYYIGYSQNKFVKQFCVFYNLCKLLIKEKYKNVHIHGDVANKLIVSALAARYCGVDNIILHSHASNVDGNHRVLKRIIHKASCRLLKYIGNKFVSCSDVAAEWMYPNINKDRIVYVKNGIDLNRFRYDNRVREKIRAKINLNTSFVVGHVGRFAYQKNHEYLMRIFASLKQKMPQAKLLLVGEGVLKDNIVLLAKKLGVLDSVIFYGISNKINDLLQAVDVFVLPSHFEGLPIVGVEAQAAGLPVIFSSEITQTAKLTANVEYLPIDNDSISDWVKKIMDFSHVARYDTYSELKKQGFEITDTINSILNLYV